MQLQVLQVYHYLDVASGGNYASIDLAMQSSGTGGNVVASIRGLAEGTGENASNLAFYTATGGTLAERMLITNEGVLRVGPTSGVTPAILTARKNGTCIEFGHGNNTGRYEGTLGVFGSNGSSYIGFATSCDTSVNTFTTRGAPGNIINGDNNGNLIFYQVTNSNASGQTPTERMRITSGGYVGIGNANPQTNLTIGSAQGNSLEFTYDSTNGYRNIISNHWDSSTDTRMDFNIGRTGNVAPVPVMSVGYGGNVGIGTTSPTSKLTIDNGSASGGSLLKSSSSAYTAHFIGNTGTGSAGVYMDAMDGDFIGSNYGFIGQNNAGYMEYNVSPNSPLPYHYFAQNVGIGTTSPPDKLYVDAGTASIYAGNFVYGGTDGTKGCLRLRTVASTGPSFIDFFYDGFSTNPLSPVGAIVTTGTATSYASFSDYRMKQNVNDLTNVLDKVVNLKPKTFNYKNVPDVEVQGFLAHELQEVIPQANL
jgi:hypothetical protein